MGFSSLHFPEQIARAEEQQVVHHTTSGFYSHLTSFLTTLWDTGTIPNLSSELSSVLNTRELSEAKQTA